MYASRRRGAGPDPVRVQPGLRAGLPGRWRRLLLGQWFTRLRHRRLLLDHLRRGGGDALPILAVNPGIAPADAGRWRYLGYKGGSEPGVIAMSFLAQRQDGDWYALSASWNNPAAPVDEARFVALVTRALNLLAQEAPAR